MNDVLTDPRLMLEREMVMRFAGAMLSELQRNSTKYGWQSCSPKWLLNRARQELGELARAIESGDDAAILSEAADVANFAAMIADVRGCLR